MFPTNNGSIHLFDGTVNVALLNANDPKDPNDEVRAGMNHFGFHLEDQAGSRYEVLKVSTKGNNL